MTSPILSTKLRMPALREKRVARPHLLSRLDEGAALPLTLLSAPAGFGKTSLLVEWAASRRREVAWLALDEGDNDPVRFLTYLLAALQSVDEGLGQGLEQLIQAPRFTDPVDRSADRFTPLTDLLTPLINQIADLPPARQLVLVLDDYHVIYAEPVHTAVRFLLDNLPGQLHLWITARADPPLPLARLRGRGLLVELHTPDLEFSPREAAEFLEQVMGVDLPPEQVQALTTRTEGWISGLQMASLALRGLPRGPETAAEFVRAFMGTNRFVGDYLIEEVLSRVSPEIQTFLVATSILDRLSGPLCDAVLGEENQDIPTQSAAILEHLDKSNLFTIPLDDQRQWYRYHNLFAELLQKRLRQAHPESLPGLYARASRWCEANSLPQEAIHYALAGKDFERAAQWVEANVESMLMRSEIVTLLGWSESLPEAILHAHPLLCAYHAAALLMTGRSFEEIEKYLQLAARSVAGAGAAAIIRAILATFQGKTALSIQLSQATLDNLPESSPFLRSVASWNLGMAHFLQGDTEKTLQMLGQAAHHAEAVGNWLLAVTALTHTAETCIAQGRLQQAQALYERALGLAQDSRGRPLPIAGSVMIGMGELYRQWDNLDAALQWVERGLQQTRRWGELGELEGYFVLVNIGVSQGNIESAQRAVEKARRLAERFDTTQIDDLYVALYQVKIDLQQGALEAVRRWVDSQPLAQPVLDQVQTESRTPYFYQMVELEQCLLGRACLRLGLPRRTLETLEPLEKRARQAGRLGSLAEIHLIQALAYQALGDKLQAGARLSTSIDLAEPGGYVRLFLDEGEPAEKLLQAALPGLKTLRQQAYARKLLAAFTPLSAVPKPSLTATSLVEPLNTRELEVLRGLAQGLSSREIAERMIVALSTVKWHTNNLYGKLGVHSRTQALAKARELKLL